MINAEDEILPDFRTSCTQEEAVAKMLGWMQGAIRRRIIKVTQYGIAADQLPFLPSLDVSLQEQLKELREAARQEFIIAAEVDDIDDEVLTEKEEAVLKIDELIRKAAAYLVDIDDEIAKGESSALRIDQHATDSSGVIHLTLKSVDQWARKNYGISIDGTSPNNPPNLTEYQQENGSALARTKARNLYTTFAFLVEAFANTAPKFGNGEGKPNVSNIAAHVAALASKTDVKDALRGQSIEAIKSCIEVAMKIKKEKLLGK